MDRLDRLHAEQDEYNIMKKKYIKVTNVLMGILLLSLIGKGALLYLHDTEKKAYNQ
jgi:hypothetical protein